MMGSSFLFHFSWPLFHLLCIPSWVWEQCEGRALPQLPYCLKEVHRQLHLIDSFIIALLMMTFPILSVQLFSPLWFQLLIIPHQSALIWWGSQRGYCFPHSHLLPSAVPRLADLTQAECRAANNIKGGGPQHFDTSAEGCDRGWYNHAWAWPPTYTQQTCVHTQPHTAYSLYFFWTCSSMQGSIFDHNYL